MTLPFIDLYAGTQWKTKPRGDINGFARGNMFLCTDRLRAAAKGFLRSISHIAWSKHQDDRVLPDMIIVKNWIQRHSVNCR